MNVHESSCCIRELHPPKSINVLSFVWLGFFKCICGVFVCLFVWLFFVQGREKFIYNGLLLLQDIPDLQSILVSESEIRSIIELINSCVFLREKQIDLLIRLCLPSQYLLISTYKC